ncbi:MAG: NAD(+)/NADH kinase [Candidatus Omnitrophica bacterium]|nr:NAD(+)/NADH kinase [Candidatus Omnitrophota bacterium]
MQKIGIVVNKNKPHALELVSSLRSLLESKGKEVEDSLTKPLEELIRGKDLLVCLGGDGTILRVAGIFTSFSVPVLGINVGSLGFLTEVKAKEALDELSSVLGGKYQVEKRLMMRVKIKQQLKGEPQVMQALNDIVINRENLTRYLRIKILADSEPLMDYSGDGVIFSTPTGSTAYSLSAGGPLLYPTLDSFVVTPICAHALLMRPIVLPADKIINIGLTSEKDKEKAVLTVDGQRNVEVSGQDEIVIERSPVSFPLIVSSKRSYLKTLREKFGMST